jgi:hypothetical protein
LLVTNTFCHFDVSGILETWKYSVFDSAKRLERLEQSVAVERLERAAVVRIALHQSLIAGRHNNLKIVQHSNLMIVQRENLMNLQHHNLT